MSCFSTKVRLFADVDVETMAEEGISLAKKLGTYIEFDYKGVRFYLHPDDNIAQVIEWMKGTSERLITRLEKPDLIPSKPEFLRSPDWYKVRKRHLEKNPVCAWSGRTSNLEVHHIYPVHLYPELELDEGNLITLSEAPDNFHFIFGHFMDWKSYNPDIVDHAEWYRKRKSSRYLKRT